MIDENINPMQGETNEWNDNEGIFDHEPEPMPDPEPFPAPDPEPFPDPTPEPTPDPEPVPDPDIDPVPGPIPNPKPTPNPKSGLNPDDDIEELLKRTEHLERIEREKPASIAKKMCPTRHGCQGATDCDYCMGNYPI